MCCCMLLPVLIKLYIFAYNNSFCNTFGANVYSPVKIIKLLLKLKNVGCVQLCAVFSGCAHLCVVFSIFIDQWTTRARLSIAPKICRINWPPMNIFH